MKADIPVRKVEGLMLAIVPEEGALDTDICDAYLINQRGELMRNVLIAATGYGTLADGELRRTTTMRYFFDDVAPDTFVRIEPVSSEVFGLNNEYWVSFQGDDGYLYDKKYVFVAGSIAEEYFTYVPLIGRRGVLLR
jgi:hypothetical protein